MRLFLDDGDTRCSIKKRTKNIAHIAVATRVLERLHRIWNPHFAELRTYRCSKCCYVIRSSARQDGFNTSSILGPAPELC